jgi:long-chain fatty acid transport protein
MIRRAFALCLAAGLAHAEFSPLSSEKDGQGMPIAPMEARERGMGEAGMAALSSKGFFLPNVSRSAYFDRTSFTATLESDMDWLRDNSSSSHNLTTAVPTLGTFIKTPKAGTFGLYYQQTYLRHFGVARDTAGIEEGYDAEGGLYQLGLSWAYSPIPLFALGVAGNFVLGHDRFIDRALLANSDSTLNAENLQDTLEMTRLGFSPTFSATLHQRRFDIAVAFTPEVNLNTRRENRITGMLVDSISDTSRASPMALAAGVGWRVSSRQTAIADVYLEDWKGGTGSFLNLAYKIAVGYELRGLDNPFEEYHKRLTYRGGLGYDLLYLRKTPEIYGTLGMGFPLGPRGHVLDVSLKYGHRSFSGNTFFAEDYVKISASIVGVAIWGQPALKRR